MGVVQNAWLTDYIVANTCLAAERLIFLLTAFVTINLYGKCFSTNIRPKYQSNRSLQVFTSFKN